MKRVLLMMMLFTLVTTSVVALDIDDLKYLDADTCEELLEQLNVLGEQVPNGVPFQDELINLKITELNITGNVKIVDGKVVGFECGVSENSTYDLELENLSAINDIILDEDPVGTYLELKDSGAITLEAHTFGGKIKLFFANIVANVVSWFS